MVKQVSFERLEWMLGLTDEQAARERSGVLHRERERRLVRQAVEQVLTPAQKQAVLLYYYRRMTMPQIARLQGCNKSNVSRTLKRARRNLMQALQYLPFLHGMDWGEEE